MYTKNMSRPNTVPCGTPDLTGATSDNSPSTITLWCHSVSQEEIQ